MLLTMEVVHDVKAFFDNKTHSVYTHLQSAECVQSDRMADNTVRGFLIALQEKLQAIHPIPCGRCEARMTPESNHRERMEFETEKSCADEMY